MGLLVVFFVVVAIIIIVAKLGSRMRPETERLPEEEGNAICGQSEDHELSEKETLDALIAILVRKEVLNLGELHIEIAANRKAKQ